MNCQPFWPAEVNVREVGVLCIGAFGITARESAEEGVGEQGRDLVDHQAGILIMDKQQIASH